MKKWPAIYLLIIGMHFMLIQSLLASDSLDEVVHEIIYELKEVAKEKEESSENIQHTIPLELYYLNPSSQTDPVRETEGKKVDSVQPDTYEKKGKLQREIQNERKKGTETTTSSEEQPESESVKSQRRRYREDLRQLSQNACDDVALNRLLVIARDWQYQKSRRPKALKIFKAYLKCHPEDANILYETGRLELWMGKNKASIQTLEEALELNPENMDAAEALVVAYTRQKQWEEANGVLSQYPHLNNIEMHRALISAQQKNFAQAQKYYEGVLANNPQDVEASRGLARSLAAQKKYKESKEQYQKLVALEPKNQRNWIESMYVRSFTNVSAFVEGSFTQSRESDPDIGKPVVKDFYTLGSLGVYVPIFNRWRLSAKEIFLQHKQIDIFPPTGINYNVSVQGTQIHSEVFLWRDFKWDLTLRLVSARGYNHHVLFPTQSKVIFEPGTSLVYSSAWQFILINSHVESFIIKNFSQGVSQLLRTVYIDATYILKPNIKLIEPELEFVFDEVFYHDSIRNRRNTFYMQATVNLFQQYVKLLYKFRQSHFKNVTPDYFTFIRQFVDTIGGVFDLTFAQKFNLNCTYEHWWEYDVGLVQSIGAIIFAADKQRIQGDTVTILGSYQLKDRLKIELEGHITYTTFPYKDYTLKGRIFWQF